MGTARDQRRLAARMQARGQHYDADPVAGETQRHLVARLALNGRYGIHVDDVDSAARKAMLLAGMVIPAERFDQSPAIVDRAEENRNKVTRLRLRDQVQAAREINRQTEWKQVKPPARRVEVRWDDDRDLRAHLSKHDASNRREGWLDKD